MSLFVLNSVSARTPPPVEKVSGDLADSTRQLVRDAALLLLLLITVVALASGSALRGNSWRSRVDGLSGISSSFHAGSLVTVRSVKYGVSSLTDFVSERLHCHLVLCACWHNGSKAYVLVTRRAINTLEVHSDSQLPWCDSQVP